MTEPATYRTALRIAQRLCRHTAEAREEGFPCDACIATVEDVILAALEAKLRLVPVVGND